MSDAIKKSAGLRDDLSKHIDEKYGAQPEHLWTQYPEYEVFRHEPKGSEKGKWFCLIANATYQQLGVEGPADEEIFAAVVKCEPERVLELIHEPGYARGYHMNKKDWLTIALDGLVPASDIEKLVDASFQLTD